MVFKTPKKPREEKLHKLTPAERARLEEIENNAIAHFAGNLDELESALGLLRLGHHVGWKVLYLIHSKKTIRKYEDILTGDSEVPVRIRELFEEVGPSAYRSAGFRIVEGVSNFWKAISGEVKLPTEEKRAISR